MKQTNKLIVFFILMFVFACGSVFAADYNTEPDVSVSKIAISEASISAVANQPYTGKAITPLVTVKYGDTTLVKDTDYTVTYANNTKIGTAKIIVEGIGNYEGTKTVTFKILKNIASTTVSGMKSKTYTGGKQSQSLTVKYGKTTLKSGRDYTISYKNNVNAGTATVTITGKGNYAGVKTLTFKIGRRSITGLSFSKVKNYTYTGKAIKPSVTVKYGKTTLKKDTDYSVSYSKNTNVGTATVTITGKGNYTGTKKITFKINKRAISSASISGLVSKTYNTKKQTQSLKLTYNGLTLKSGTHYTLSYKNNIKAGTATVTITGKGNFTGSVKKTFKISKRNLSSLTITASKSAVYSGSAIKPSVKVVYGKTTLKNGTDYTVSYSKNTNVGTATITVTGKGNYTGTEKLTFTIKARNISTVNVSGLASKTYTGSKQSQSLKLTYKKLTLKSGTHYTLSYKNNVKAGTATVTITGKGNFTGTKTLTFKIGRRSVTGLSFSKVKNYTYTGKGITPSVKVVYGKTTLVKDTDYTVSYSKNTNVGTATVTITGKGNYTGTKKITFKISSRSISSASIEGLVAKAYTGKNTSQSLKLTYNGITLKYKTDYTLSYTNHKNIGKATITITGKGNFTGTKKITYNIVPVAPQIASAAVTEKNIKVTWNKISHATGYVLYMSKDGGSYTKVATISKNSTTNYTVKDLADGEYSFKIRAYKAVSKTNYYSSYSSVKTQTIKTVEVPVPSIKFGEKVTGTDSSVQYTILMENTADLDGVEVYYATSETGEYKLIRSYSKADFTSYDIAVEIPKNAHYYFKVRGYIKVNDNAKYGEYSNVIDYNNEVKDGKVTYILGENIEIGLYKLTPIDSTKNIVLTEYIPPEVYESLPPGAGFGIESEEMHKGYVEITEDYEGIIVENATLEKITLEDIPTNIKTSVSNGMYVVGKDITTGMYKVTSSTVAEIKTMNSAALGDWSNLEQLQSGYIEITDDTKFVNVLNGTMTKVDIDELPVDIKTEISHDDYTSGTYIVGKDIEPGIYEITGTYNPEWYESYVKRYSSVITDWENELGAGYVKNETGIAYIEVLPTDTAIYIYNASIRKITFEEIPVNIRETVSDGIYIVGKDLACGIYKVEVNKENDNLEAGYTIMTFSNLSFNYDAEYQSNYYSGSYGYIELTEEEKVISIINGTLTKVDLNEMPEDIKTSVTTGTYIVGKDIAPGTYKATGIDGSSAYVARLSSIDRDDIIEEYSAEEVYIEVKETDIAVYVGEWTLLEKVEEQPTPTISLDESTVETIENKTYTGVAITPKPVVKIGSTTLVEGTDYTLTYSNNVEVGTATITITGKGNYTGTKVVTFEIIKKEEFETVLTDGTYIVGKDIETGLYRMERTLTYSPYCYVYGYSDSNKENYTFSNAETYGYVEITADTAIVEIMYGTLTKIDLDKLPVNLKDNASDGEYLVGYDIAPGLYKITGTEAIDDYSDSGVTGYSDYKMSNKIFSNQEKDDYFEITSDMTIVEIHCASLKLIDINKLPIDIKSSVTDGDYFVGYDLEPGVYKLESSTENDCSVEGIIGNQKRYSNTVKLGYFEITSDMSVVRVSGGSLTKIDLERTNIKTDVSIGEYLVGYDLEPGLYKMTGTKENYAEVSGYADYNKNEYICDNYVEVGYFEITSDMSIIKVESGTLTKVDLNNIEKDIKTNVAAGKYIVGIDLEPGLYKVMGDYDTCEVTGFSDYNMTKTICSNYTKLGYFEITKDMIGIEVLRGNIEKLDINNLPVNIKENVSTGEYLVGYDIAPGLYKIDYYCYGYSDYNKTNQILSNSEMNSYIEISEDVLIVNVQYGTLKKVNKEDIPVDIKTSVSAGYYLVGYDLEPGVYQMKRSGLTDYYTVQAYSDYNMEYKNRKLFKDSKEGYIEITNDMISVQVYNATLTKVDVENTDIKTSLNIGEHLVGYDLEPGVYKVNGSIDCYTGYYYSDVNPIYSSTEGYIEIGNDISVIDVKTGTLEKVIVDIKDKLTSGEYIIGYDLEPGVYKMDNSNISCYSDYSMTNSVLSKYESCGYVEITDNMNVVTISQGTLTKIDFNNADIKTSVTDGGYIVGHDIEPGVYKVNLDENYHCVIKAYSDYNMNNEVIAKVKNQIGYVEITDNMRVVIIDQGTLTKVDFNNPDIKTSVANGEYIVGHDIEPGVYKVDLDENYHCIIEAYSDYNMTDEIVVKLKNKNGYVEITDNMHVVTIGGGILTKVDFNNADIKTSLTSGEYLVGYDLEPGVYKMDNSGISCYSDYSMTNNILSKYESCGYVEITDNMRIVTIAYGTLTKVDFNNPDIKTMVSEGEYIVGYDLDIGTYKFVANEGESGASIELYLDVSELDNSLYGDYGYVEITENHKYVHVNSGTLIKVELENLPVDIKTTINEGIYIVGKDIFAGTYKVVSCSAQGCNATTLASINTTDKIQSFKDLEIGSIVTVKDSDYALWTMGVTLEKVEDTQTATVATMSLDEEVTETKATETTTDEVVEDTVEQEVSIYSEN